MAQVCARDTSSTQRDNLLRVRYRARWTPLSRIGTVDTSPEPGAINAEDAKEVTGPTRSSSSRSSSSRGRAAEALHRQGRCQKPLQCANEAIEEAATNVHVTEEAFAGDRHCGAAPGAPTRPSRRPPSRTPSRSSSSGRTGLCARNHGQPAIREQRHSVRRTTPRRTTSQRPAASLRPLHPRRVRRQSDHRAPRGAERVAAAEGAVRCNQGRRRGRGCRQGQGRRRRDQGGHHWMEALR